MTLRELINSVDSEQYSDSALYQKLCETKPEYGSNRRIEVKLVNGEVTITNVHLGCLGDILAYPIDRILSSCHNTRPPVPEGLVSPQSVR